MHDLMTGMFWGGLVMATPPLLLFIGVAVYAYRRLHAAGEEPPEEQPRAD